jgi:hypothetical protein
MAHLMTMQSRGSRIIESRPESLSARLLPAVTPMLPCGRRYSLTRSKSTQDTTIWSSATDVCV